MRNAEDSPQVARARRKIRDRFNEEDKLITPESLSGALKIIKSWIERHQFERIDLKQKNVELFDKNKSSASVKSKYVIHMMQKLQTAAKPPKARKLGGRVTAPDQLVNTK